MFHLKDNYFAGNYNGKLFVNGISVEIEILCNDRLNRPDRAGRIRYRMLGSGFTRYSQFGYGA